MTELTDLEICTKIAEIEGLSITTYDEVLIEDFCLNVKVIDDVKGKLEPSAFLSLLKGIQYNPLTDDGLCFRLMVKYRIKIIYEAYPDYYHAFVTVPLHKVGYSDGNPNKAICLAIIEANK